MKWVDSAASRLRQRQNRTFATRASAAAGGSSAAAAAVAAMALGGGVGGRGGGRNRKRPRRKEAVVVAGGLASEEEEEGIVGAGDEPTEQLSVRQHHHAQPQHSHGSFFERAENAAAQQQQPKQPKRRRRLRNGGSVISASVAAPETFTCESNASSSDAMTLPPSFSRRRPSRRSSMPSSFGGAGPTLGQMQAAFLAQRLQQHRQRQQEQQHGTMPPPMPREAKRRRSIATSTSADEFNLDLDESGRSTPLRSNSSGGGGSASGVLSSASTSASGPAAGNNPFAIDLDGPSEFLACEDLLQRTCLPQPGQVGFAEHMAGVFLKDVAASHSAASSGSSVAAAATTTASRRAFSRRMSLPSPQDMSRRAQMTGGGVGGGLQQHGTALNNAPGNNREMMQLLRAQHQQLQMQWQAQAQAKAEAQAHIETHQEGTATTGITHRQQRRTELFTSSGGSGIGTTTSSMGTNSTSSPSSAVPPPFAFKYSLSDRSLDTGESITAVATGAATKATEGGLQRFKKRPSESIYANEVEMTGASSHHPKGGTEDDDEVCIEIHSTTSAPGEGQPPSSRAAIPAAAASVRLTTGTSGTSGISSSSHSVSPPCHETDTCTSTAAGATIKAPAIRFFNNGVEVNEAGVPIVSPAVPAKPLAHQMKIPLSSQAQGQETNDEIADDYNAGGITAKNTSPYFAGRKNSKKEGEASLSPPLSRSCSVTDVISFAVKRVPELTTRMALSNDEADPAKIDDVLQALYAIASDAKSEASPKAPAAETDAEARQVHQSEQLQARLSTTIRSVEGYRRGKATKVAKEKALMGPTLQATATKTATAAIVGPHADLINTIFGGGSQHQQKRRSSADGRPKRSNVDRPALKESSGSESTLDGSTSSSSLNDMVRDSFKQREKHVDAATALLGLGDGRQ